MARQEVAFKRQVQLAHQLGKPQVSHLRGQYASRTSAIYDWALDITSILRKQHPVYLDSFSVTQAEFMLWHLVFPKLLVGCSCLMATDVNCCPLLWMVPTGTLALEMDSTHLAPRIGWVNDLIWIWAQEMSTAEICNAPAAGMIKLRTAAALQLVSPGVGLNCF